MPGQMKPCGRVVLGKGCLLFGTCTCPPNCDFFIPGSAIDPANCSQNIYCRFLDHPGDDFTCEETGQYIEVICEYCERVESREWPFKGDEEEDLDCAPETTEN
ncbi:MAG: hypothetical protein ACFFCZ_15215 [Promethearchaeota archaeon]